MLGPDQGVLHDDDVSAEMNLAVLRREYSAVEDAGAFAEDDGTAECGRGRNVGGGGDDRLPAAVLKDHADAA